jgi:ketosteroid isomerase-like protein
MSRHELNSVLTVWYKAWNDHDLDGVMDLIHDDIVFINWDGKIVIGKAMLHKAWSSWFGRDKTFQFVEEETFVDEVDQKALFRWVMHFDKETLKVKKHGVDVLHFADGKIVRKLTYSRRDGLK